MHRTPSSYNRLARLAQALVAALALTAFTARAEPVIVKDLDIFVDLPTAFAFIKMPRGWKFVGQLDAQTLGKLPAGVHTSLLPADDDVVRIAEPALPQPPIDALDCAPTNGLTQRR
jgi:hypothetical protein